MAELFRLVKYYNLPRSVIDDVVLADTGMTWDVMFRNVVISGCARSDPQDSPSEHL